MDPSGRLFPIDTSADVRLEADGWRFGHRADRGVYPDLEPESLTEDEYRRCTVAVELVCWDKLISSYTCGQTITPDARNCDRRDAGRAGDGASDSSAASDAPAEALDDSAIPDGSSPDG